MPESAIAFISAFIFAMVLTPLVRWVCLRYSLHAAPNPIIATHKTPVPTLGGIAVYLALFATLAVIAFSGSDTFSKKFLLALFLGSFPLFLVGIYDDLKNLSVKFKFVFEAALTVVFILAFNLRPDFGVHPVFDYLLMIFWFTGIINAVNLIDIMDGLASGVGLFASLAFFTIAVFSERLDLMPIATALTGCYLAFLYYNFNPAKVFLGDNGSLVMGLAMAYLGFELVNGQPMSIKYMSPVIILAIPIFEVILLIIRRKKKGIPVTKGSPDHLGLVLQARGNSIPKSAIMIYLAAGMIALLGILVWNSELIMQVTVVLIVLIMGLIILKLMINVEIPENFDDKK